MTTTLPVAADGCILPNITTREYRITMTAPCEHTKVRHAEIVITATSAEAARAFAGTQLRQGALRTATITQVTEVCA
jgi:hypothetical protein